MRLCRPVTTVLLLAPLAAQTEPARPAPPVPARGDPRDALRTEELFAHGVTPDLRLLFDDAARDALRKEPRQYVKRRCARATATSASSA